MFGRIGFGPREAAPPGTDTPHVNDAHASEGGMWGDDKARGESGDKFFGIFSGRILKENEAQDRLSTFRSGSHCQYLTIAPDQRFITDLRTRAATPTSIPADQ